MAAGGSVAASSIAAAQGSDCAVDSVLGVTLCTTISLCPSLSVDHDVYPDCGFRVNGTAIDVECVCNDELCPLGEAASCADAQTLMGQQTEALVCTQISEGGCIVPRGASTSTATATSTCDTTCRTECAGEPTCLLGCGC